MAFLRHHWLTMLVAVLAVVSFAAFSWAEYGYFCDQASDHGSACSGFFSAEHLHDWVYNATSNYQSELLFGVLIVILLNKARGGDSA